MLRGYILLYLGVVIWVIGAGTGKYIRVPESSHSFSSSGEIDTAAVSTGGDVRDQRTDLCQILEADDGPKYPEQKNDDKNDFSEISFKPSLLRPKRDISLLRLPIPARLALFSGLVISEALRFVNSTIYDMNKNKSVTSEEQQQTSVASVELEKPLNQIETKANISANDLRQFHSTVLYGVMKACPRASKNYNNMLKMVDRSSNSKIKLIEARLPLTPSNPKLTSLFGRIRKCYKTRKTFTVSPFARAASSEDEYKPVSDKKRSSSMLDRIRAYLDEEGKKLRRSAQLDIVPTSENLIQFEKLGLQLISHLCKMDDETEAEHHRIGTLLLSALKSASTVPKATVHQTEMEELIAETRKCLKTYNQKT